MKTGLLLCTFVVAAKCFIPRSNTLIKAFHHPKTPNRRDIFSTFALDDEILELCEENANAVVEEIRKELGTMFGYDAGSRAVGISGEIEFTDIDGAVISVALKGRFWHATDTVMVRVKSYVMQRIPECIDVVLDMKKSSIIDDNRLNTDGGPGRRF